MDEIYRNIGIIIFCYLLGAIPFCKIVAKIFTKKDLTAIGDKNPGGANLIFNVSKFWGAIGSLLDLAKGFISYYFVLEITGLELMAILAGCAAVIGHNYSPYLKFTGGKGLAAAWGIYIAINPFTPLIYIAGILLALIAFRNSLWGIVSGIICSGIFLWIIKDSSLNLILTALLLFIIVPKLIDSSESILENFRFFKEKDLKGLFRPKV